MLRVTGQAKAAKRGAERSATNGLVAFADGALLQLGAETDFVAKNDEFQALADDVVKAVAAAGPTGRGRQRGHAAVRQDRGRGHRATCRHDRREARDRQRRVLRRPDRRLPAQAGRPTCRPQVGVLVEYEGDDETAARTAAMQIAAMRPQYLTPRRGPGRPGGERAPDRRGHGQGGGQARAGHARDRRGPGERVLQGRGLLDQPSVTDNKTPVGNCWTRPGSRSPGSSGSRPAADLQGRLTSEARVDTGARPGRARGATS